RKKISSAGNDPDTGVKTIGVDHVSNTINYGFAVEYSNFYLRANVHDFGLPEWVNRLTPLVEFNFVTPVTDRYGEKTVGTINPGITGPGSPCSSASRRSSPRHKPVARISALSLSCISISMTFFPILLAAHCWVTENCAVCFCVSRL